MAAVRLAYPDITFDKFSCTDPDEVEDFLYNGFGRQDSDAKTKFHEVSLKSPPSVKGWLFDTFLEGVKQVVLKMKYASD